MSAHTGGSYGNPPVLNVDLQLALLGAATSSHPSSIIGPVWRLALTASAGAAETDVRVNMNSGSRRLQKQKRPC